MYTGTCGIRIPSQNIPMGPVTYAHLHQDDAQASHQGGMVNFGGRFDLCKSEQKTHRAFISRLETRSRQFKSGIKDITFDALDGD
jgi:hypothetical protein